MPSRLDQIRDLILKARHAYYNSGEPIMSDAEYDSLEDELRRLSPGDPLLQMVGAPVPADSILTKARHAMPMGSQNKVNSETEFRTWLERCGGGAVHASLKGDGASAAAYYRDGRLVQAISRGDGVIGEDITANAIRFKGLPAWVGSGAERFTGAVRFEVILTVEDWAKVDPARSKNPRNAGSGIMGRKNGHQCEHLTAFAFDIDEQRDGGSVRFASESQKLARLAELGFNLIPHTFCSSVDEAVAWHRDAGARRDALPFWTLGVTAGRPKGQVAWKFDSSGAITRLRGVSISGGHTGALNPIAELDPVEIGGTTVSSAFLANFDEIARLDVAIGDAVWVIKANDIIPKVIRVTERAADRQPIPVPAVCPFCQGPVGRRTVQSGSEGALLMCQSAACPEKTLGKIKRWIKSLEIDGIGESVLEAIIASFPMEDPSGLYRLHAHRDALAELVINTEKGIRLGAKRAASILEAIEKTRTLPLAAFLGSLGVDYLGKRRAELMMTAAQGALDTLAAWRQGRLADPAFAEQVGVPNIGAALQARMDALGPVIDALLDAGVVVVEGSPAGSAASSDGTPARPTVCISGKLPSGRKKADYAEPLARAGYALVDEVAAGLAVLVLAEPDSNSAKAVKARKLGVRIVGEEGLREIVEEGSTL